MMEITGRLISILPAQSGQSKNGMWKKQDFVIETNEQYPKKICFTAWSDRVDELSKVSTGDTLKVFFDLSSREYNGKWYTEVKAWRIMKSDDSAPGEGTDTVRSEPGIDLDTNWEGDLPF